MEANQSVATMEPNGMELLYANVKSILATARQRAYTAVNFAMVESYWLIGQTIVEHEQHGEVRADYGKGVLKELAERLTREFGKGFDESNLRYMRLFYRNFPIRDTLRHELTWSHYRRLISIENEQARLWYMNEAADGVWMSVRWTATSVCLMPFIKMRTTTRRSASFCVRKKVKPS